MPQPFGSPGSQRGTGIALVLAAVKPAVAVAGEEVAFAWVEANMPVMARARTKARTMFFMVLVTPFLVTQSGRNLIFLWTDQMKQL
jgi:hypothetical protein